MAVPVLATPSSLARCSAKKLQRTQKGQRNKRTTDVSVLNAWCGQKVGRHWGRISSPKPTEQLEAQGHNYVTSANLGWYKTGDIDSIKLMSQRATWFIHLESNLGISEAEGCVKITKGSSKGKRRGHLCYCGLDGLCPWHHGMAAFRGGRTCLRCGSL